MTLQEIETHLNGGGYITKSIAYDLLPFGSIDLSAKAWKVETKLGAKVIFTLYCDSLSIDSRSLPWHQALRVIEDSIKGWKLTSS